MSHAIRGHEVYDGIVKPQAQECAARTTPPSCPDGQSTSPSLRDREELFAMARNFVGTRFRLHGREAETGLDCIGLVIAAYRQAGVEIASTFDDYPLRGMSLPYIINAFTASGLTLCQTRPRIGDIALIACGHGQYHVALLGSDSHIHAHAGLRRVVETPGWPDGVAGVFSLKSSS